MLRTTQAWVGLALLCLGLSLRAETVYFENFEAGWGGWSADNGVWEVGAPSEVGPPACFGGSRCAGTVLNGNYPRYTDSRLMSPSIILPAVANGESIYLHFREWHQYDTSWDDRGVVQVSVYDAAAKTWSAFADAATPERAWAPVWSRKGVDLTAHAGKKVRLGFFHIDESSSWYPYVAPGWYIDEVEILRKPSRFSGDFETGWGDWFADNGVWYVGAPTEGPAACHTGNGCAGTIPNGNYSSLIFPDYALPKVKGLDEIHLRFWNWHGTGGTGQVYVAVYDPAAETWSDWIKEGAPVGPTSGIWSPKDIDLTAYAGKKVRVALHHYDGTSATGWYIDDVTIGGGTPPANPYALTQSIRVADLNGNALPEEASLLRVNATNAVQVWLRDGQTKALIRKISYVTGDYTPIGLAEAADLNGNGKPEIAVLYRKSASGVVYATLRDGGTGAAIKTLNFGVVLAQSITVMDDTNGNGQPEIAVMSMNPAAQTYKLDLRDVGTGALVRTISLP